MIHQTHYKSGDIYGMLYLFDNAGEGLRMHKHDEEQLHNVVVMLGSIAIYGPDGDEQKVEAGNVHDFDSSMLHEIRALEPGTKLLNIYLHGMPAGYDQLPQEEYKTTYERPLVKLVNTNNEHQQYNKRPNYSISWSSGE